MAMFHWDDLIHGHALPGADAEELAEFSRLRRADASLSLD
jgi:hypothetical protein